MAAKGYIKYALTGGASNALDSIDGTDLNDGDVGLVFVSGVMHVYILDADSAQAESSPYVISPDTNAGDKRWILQGLMLDSLGGVLSTLTKSTMTGDETFTRADSNIFIKDPGGADRTFNPSGTFEAGHIVWLLNIADAAEKITFDSSGLAYDVLQGAGCAFIYDGSSWRRLNEIGELAIATSKIADAAVTTAKVADSAVTTAKLNDSSVTEAKIADLAVATAKIADAAVTEGKLADAAVTTVKIANANVTHAKLDADMKNRVFDAWINLDGITPAIRDSYNVASFVDNGTGNFTINWDTDFAAATYAVFGMISDDYPDKDVFINSLLADSLQIVCKDSTGSIDPTQICIGAVGDQ